MADVKKGKTPQEFFGGYTLLARRGRVRCVLQNVNADLASVCS